MNNTAFVVFENEHSAQCIITYSICLFVEFFSGFVKYERSTTMYRPAKQRAMDWEEIYSRKNKRELKIQAAR